MTILLPSNEIQRLKILAQYQILDTPPDTRFDDLAFLAAQVCQTPIALIGFVDRDRLWVKAKVGNINNELDRQLLPWDEIVAQQGVWTSQGHPPLKMAVNGKSQTLPLYAAVPIFTSDGYALGLMGVMDDRDRPLSPSQQQALQALSRQVTALLDSHRDTLPASDRNGQFSSEEAIAYPSNLKIVKILESITDAFFTLDRQWRFTYLNSRAEQILLRNRKQLQNTHLWEEFPELANSTFKGEFERAMSRQVTVHFEEFYSLLSIWLEVKAYPYQEGLSVYFRDVTTRKQAEAELLERSYLSTLATEVGTILVQGGTLPDILERCANAIVQELDVAGAKIWLFATDSQMLELQAVAGQLSYSEAFPVRIAIGISIIGFIAHNRQPYHTNNLLKDAWFGASTWAEEEQLSAFAGYPLIVEDRLIGVMAVFSKRAFSVELDNTLSWVANAIAVAVDRSWAREALMSRRESLLFQLANQIRKSLDLNTILTTAVSEIRNLLNIDRCQFMWCWPHQAYLSITHESAASDIASGLGDFSPTDTTILMEKIQNLETLRIEETHDSTSELAEDTDLGILQASLFHQGISSQLLVPLETRTGQLGAIICSHCSGPRPWSNSEVELLQAVTDQLAIAIDQAELYAQTHAAAFAAKTQAEQLSEALETLKSTQAQLIQHEKMSSLGQMIAGIAHEINNPVNFITGNLTHASNYIEDLMDLLKLYQGYYPNADRAIQDKTQDIDLEFLEEDLPSLLESMQVGAERIRQIVLSLRNFSRLDESEMKPVNIHEGIDNTLMILQHRLKPKAANQAIQVIKEYGDLPQIECYPGQLNQVFMNILSNAIDALEASSELSAVVPITSYSSSLPLMPTIWIQTKYINDRWIAIHVIDNGQGMSEEVRSRLFDPFFTTKPVGKGTGLGLSISYQIVVEKHKGKLQCFSEVGKGAEFIIAIPIAPTEPLT